MSQRSTTTRSMHDLGLATWFGGSLMGAVGLNGAAAAAHPPPEVLRLSSKGWARWAPVNAVAIGAHLLGGSGLLAGNKSRLTLQPEARQNTSVKTGLTVAALALTAYSGYLGRQVAKHERHGAPGATEPDPSAPTALRQAQSRLRAAQWAIPAVTGALIVLGAQQGEQQRPLAGLLSR